jgi:hypothetical protein
VRDPRQALAAIAELLAPCPCPDWTQGYDLCTCGSGQGYPCNITAAAWIARGLEPAAEASRALRQFTPIDEYDPSEAKEY